MHLVGNRQGRKVIRWGHVGLNFLIYAGAAAVAAAAVYVLVAGHWNPTILLVGPVVGIIATLSSLIISLRTPIHQLPLLNW